MLVQAGSGRPARSVELFRRQSTAAFSVPAHDVASEGRILVIPVPGDEVTTLALDALMPSRINVAQDWFRGLENKAPTRC